MKFEEAAEIVFGLTPDNDFHNSKSQKLNAPVGPNDWDNIEPEDFGPEHDFELENHTSIWIFTAVSNAALQWCYAHLPADCPRWGAKGFAIEARYIADIVAGAQRDNLMSEQDYIDAMEEANAIQHQGVEE